MDDLAVMWGKGRWVMAKEARFFVGFGSLEALVHDLTQDGVRRVRVTDVLLPGHPGKYGIALDQGGVMVAARVGEEVRYAWVLRGFQQKLLGSGVVLEGKDLPERVEAAYAEIVDWLEAAGFEVRGGVYDRPADARLMRATASCLRKEEDDEGGAGC